MTPEDEALHLYNTAVDPITSRIVGFDLSDTARRRRETYDLLVRARVLRTRFQQVFALRALCHRGRATPTSDTPEAFTLLVYAPSCRPKTRAAWRRAPAGLLDPIAQLVCQFWLGNPPHRYRRAVPAGE